MTIHQVELRDNDHATGKTSSLIPTENEKLGRIPVTAIDLDQLHLDRSVSGVLATYAAIIGRVLDGDRHQELQSLTPLIRGTADDGFDEARSKAALDWLIRTWTPAWADLGETATEARQLRELDQIVDLATAERAGEVVRAAHRKARRIGDDAWNTYGGAINAANYDAVWSRSGGALGFAAWRAIRVRQDDLAWAAGGDAALYAAGYAAWDITLNPARFQQTVDQMQTSAVELFGAMIRPGVQA
jgi:hypothetical protein